MKKLKLGLVIVFALTALNSCKKGGVFCYKGNGDVTTEIRELNNFNEISLELAAEVIYIQSDESRISIEASSNLMQFIETDIQNSVLEIDFKKDKCYNSKEPLLITVYSPNIKGLSISGSGSIKSHQLLTADALSISISGSGNINLDSINIVQLKASISGSGKLTASSNNTLDSQDITVSGSGSINFLNVPTLTSNISVSGSGNCDVHVLNSLKIDVSGSGNTRYKGTPSVTTNISGSGSVRPY